MPYATLEDLTRYLDVSEDVDDVLLQACINRATDSVETYTARVFEAAAGSKYYDREALEANILWLDADLCSLTSIANGDDDATPILPADVDLLPRNFGPPYDRIRLKTSSTHAWQVDEDCWIEIVGDWGWSAEPPNDIVQATLRWAAYFYRQRDAQVFDVTAQPEQGIIVVPQGIPADVKMLIEPYRKRI